MLKTMKSFFYRQKNIEAFIAATIAFFITLSFTKSFGIGVSPDSVVYASVARNLNAGLGWMEFSGNSLVDFPVLFPSFLGVIMLFSGIDPIAAAPYVVGLLFAGVIFCSSYLIDTLHFRSTIPKYLTLICIILSPSLIEIYTMLWSETLFILLVLLFLLSWKKYQDLHQQKCLIISAVITAFACITRYAGITLIATGCLLLLTDFSLGNLKKIKSTLLFGAVSGSLFILNLVRNALITGLLTGERQKGSTTFSENIYYCGAVIGEWLSFFNSPHSAAFLSGVFTLLLIGILFLWHVFHQTQRKQTLQMLSAFFLVYVLFIVISSTLSRYETINNRLLSPALIPFLIAVSGYYMLMIQKLKQPFKRLFLVMGCLLALTFAFREYQTDLNNYKIVDAEGIPGFTDNSYHQSGLVTFLKNKPIFLNAKLPFYSNNNAAAYFFTSKNCQPTPSRFYQKEQKDFLMLRSGYLIWFNNEDDPEYLSLAEIKSSKNLKLLYQFKDGAVYFFEKQTLKK